MVNGLNRRSFARYAILAGTIGGLTLAMASKVAAPAFAEGRADEGDEFELLLLWTKPS